MKYVTNNRFGNFPSKMEDEPQQKGSATKPGRGTDLPGHNPQVKVEQPE